MYATNYSSFLPSPHFVAIVPPDLFHTQLQKTHAIEMNENSTNYLCASIPNAFSETRLALDSR